MRFEVVINILSLKDRCKFPVAAPNFLASKQQRSYTAEYILFSFTFCKVELNELLLKEIPTHKNNRRVNSRVVLQVYEFKLLIECVYIIILCCYRKRSPTVPISFMF